LELIFALDSQANIRVEVEAIETPPQAHRHRRSIFGSTYFYNEIVDPDKIPLLWDKYRKLLKKNKHPELNYSIQWFMRAIKSENPIDKFIYTWITFNMLFGWLTQAPIDKPVRGINELTQQNIPPFEHQKEIVSRNVKVLEELSLMKLIGRENKDRAERLRTALKRQNTKQILVGAVEAISHIRNHIFHGSIEDRAKEAGRCVGVLIHLNAEIIKHQLNKI
jgi:hypothetical protein